MLKGGPYMANQSMKLKHVRCTFTGDGGGRSAIYRRLPMYTVPKGSFSHPQFRG